MALVVADRRHALAQGAALHECFGHDLYHGAIARSSLKMQYELLRSCQWLAGRGDLEAQD